MLMSLQGPILNLSLHQQYVRALVLSYALAGARGAVTRDALVRGTAGQPGREPDQYPSHDQYPSQRFDQWFDRASELGEDELVSWISSVKRVETARPVNKSFIDIPPWIEYDSAIALRLSRSLQREPLAIATDLIATLQESILLASSRPEHHHHVAIDSTLWRHVAVSVSESGWLTFRLSELGVAHWLQSLHTLACTAEDLDSLKNTAKIPSKIAEKVDSWSDRAADIVLNGQYAYARCHMLLRRVASAQIQPCTPLSWLDDANQPHLSDDERCLVAHLMDAVDAIALRGIDANAETNQAQTKLMLRLLQSLSTDVLIVDARHRIVRESAAREIAAQKNDVAQEMHPAERLADERLAEEGLTGDRHPIEARLGLIRITQFVLRILLEQGLGAIAPRNL